jgi:hypothetical protein
MDTVESFLTEVLHLHRSQAVAHEIGVLPATSVGQSFCFDERAVLCEHCMKKIEEIRRPRKAKNPTVPTIQKIDEDCTYIYSEIYSILTYSIDADPLSESILKIFLERQPFSKTPKLSVVVQCSG